VNRYNSFSPKSHTAIDPAEKMPEDLALWKPAVDFPKIIDAFGKMLGCR